MMKAQLILVGGRSFPSILTILHQKPDLVVAVCSEQSAKSELPELQKALRKLLGDTIIWDVRPVDGYVVSDVENACRRALNDNLEKYSEWIFNLTSATKIMGFGAYRVAQEYTHKLDLQCLYLDTASHRVVSLIGRQLPADDIYKIRLGHYMNAYNHRVEPSDVNMQNTLHWLPFTEYLMDNIEILDDIRSGMVANKAKGNSIFSIYSMPYTSEREGFCCIARDFQFFSDFSCKNGVIDISIPKSSPHMKYLNGTWLEAYVWNHVRNLGVFTDCIWNHKLIGDENDYARDAHEIDVMMMCRSHLFLIECKTGEEASWSSKSLLQLDSLAEPIGGNFVTKIFVHTFPEPKTVGQHNQHKRFCAKAKERKIIVLDREDVSTKLDIKLAELAKKSLHR